MVIYIRGNWVLESNTEGLNVSSDKKFMVYNPKKGMILFENDDMNRCIKFAEKSNEITLEDFKREYLNNLYPKKWDFDLFKVKCNKCNSEKVEVNGIAESESGYYGEHSLKLRIWCKCHSCGNFMGVDGDNLVEDEPFIQSEGKK